MDGGYGNNSSLLEEIKKRELKYIGIIAKNRKVKLHNSNKISSEKRIDEIAKSLPKQSFQQIKLGKNL